MSIKSNSSEKPLIVISYCHDDEMWRDRLVKAIQSRGSSFEIFDDRIVGRGGLAELSPATGEALEKATVLVVLLSPSYFEASWMLRPDSREVLAPFLSSGLWITPAVVHDCPWQEIPLFRELKVRPDHSAISSMNPEYQDKFLDDFAVSVVGLLSDSNESTSSTKEADESSHESQLDVLSGFSLSNEVREAVDMGRALATSSESSKRLTTSCLLFGLAEVGRGTGNGNTAQFLFRQLTQNGEDLYRKEFISKFPLQPYPSGGKIVPLNSIVSRTTEISPHAFQIFELAQQISKQTYHPQTQGSWADGVENQIHAYHLLAALLTSPKSIGVFKRLSRIVPDVGQLRYELFELIKRGTPSDDQQGWRQILIGGEVENAQQVDGTQKASPSEIQDDGKQPLVAGFMTDYWEGRDLLGITPDVNALASLVAAFRVEPPLAIGLFGEWGSGKSHFMRQLKARVETLSRAARKSKLPQKQLGYYKNIVQIEFNAWHYIEGNLWASLVDHIFENLKFFDDEKPKLVAARRDALMADLGVKKQLVAEKTNQLKAKEEGIRARVARVNDRKQNVYQDLERFKDDLEISVLNELNIPIVFSESDRQLLARIGVTAPGLVKAADVHKTYVGAQGLRQKLLGQWRVIRTDPSALRRVVFLTALALVPVLGLLLKSLLVQQRLPLIFGSSAGLLATLLISGKPYWDQFQQSLAVLKKKDEAIQAERQQQINQLENEIKELTKQAVEAEREAADVNQQADKLAQEIENVTAGRLIAQFIEDRAAASDYRRHLGLLALIRRDFEKLRDLFREQREAEDEGKEETDRKKINRIVLYIDDLDRCLPERVVQVLQAIHLLLAFPLFVVVVGVDSRWVTRALQQSYEWLRDDDEVDEATNGHKSRDARKEEDDRDEGATPHDYLEKIFQIPFWLKPMDAISCVEFLDGITRDPDKPGDGNVKDKEMPVDKEPAKSSSSMETKLSDAVSKKDGDAARTPDEPHNTTEGKDPKDSETRAADNQLTADDARKTKEEDDEDKEHDEEDKEHDDGEKVDVAPRSLKFGEIEVKYMKELAPLIGRSPRAVKRFLNCYRLIKVGLSPKQFDVFIGEEGEANGYKATMILLGVITGTPKVSSDVLGVFDSWPKTKPKTVENLMEALKAKPEILAQPDGQKLRTFFEKHLVKPNSDALFAEMLACAGQVSRFSFRVVGAETLGQRKSPSTRKKTKQSPASRVM